MQQGSSFGPVHLQKAEVFIVERSFCKQRYEASKVGIFNTHICALNPFEQKGACNVSIEFSFFNIEHVFKKDNNLQ